MTEPATDPPGSSRVANNVAENWRWAVVLAGTVGALSSLGLVVQLLPLFDQINGEILAVTAPANLALVLAIRLLAEPSQAVVA